MVGSWEVYMEWTDRIKLSFAGEGIEKVWSSREGTLRHGGRCPRTRGRHEGYGGRKGAWLGNFVKTEKTRKADELGA